jgi:hypothetical protein
MGKAIEYNGHPSYNQWNVSLWLGNVESDYRSCIDAIEQAAKVIRATSRKPVTAERVLERATSIMMRDLEGQRTPDGARYNRVSVKHALEGFMEGMIF